MTNLKMKVMTSRLKYYNSIYTSCNILELSTLLATIAQLPDRAEAGGTKSDVKFDSQEVDRGRSPIPSTSRGVEAIPLEDQGRLQRF